MNPARNPWIDHLKALGILLVVAGHTALSVNAHNWIYAFHMPLFFIISGFLISPGGLDVPLREFFIRRVSKLLRLYLAFGLLGTLMYCYVFRQEHSLAEMLRGRIFSLIYASASKNTSEDLYPLVLWFFPALIVGLILVYAVWKIPSAWGKALASVAVFGGGVALSNRALPWEFESACMAAGFLALGHGLRIVGWDGLLQKSGARSIPFAVGALLLGSYLAILNLHCLDVRAADVGNPWLAISAGLLLILALTVVAMRLTASPVTTAVSAATILIFPTHTLIFPYFDRFAAKVPMLHAGLAGNEWWYCWCKALLVVAVLATLHFCYGLGKTRWKSRRALAAQ